MPNKANQAQVELLQEKLSQAKSVVVFNYEGASVNDMTQLRASIREVGGEVLVTKNTLIDIAVGRGKMSDSLEGMNAIVFSYEDEVGAVKKLFAFHDENDKLVIKQGLLEGDVLSPAQVESLSKLPGREELISSLLRTLKAPAHGMVNVLQAGPRNLVYALKAIANKEN